MQVKWWIWSVLSYGVNMYSVTSFSKCFPSPYAFLTVYLCVRYYLDTEDGEVGSPILFKIAQSLSIKHQNSSLGLLIASHWFSPAQVTRATRTLMYGHALPLRYWSGRFKRGAPSEPGILLLSLGVSPGTASVIHGKRQKWGSGSLRPGPRQLWPLCPGVLALRGAWLGQDRHAVRKHSWSQPHVEGRRGHWPGPHHSSPPSPSVRNRSEEALRKFSPCHWRGSEQPQPSWAQNRERW